MAADYANPLLEPALLERVKGLTLVARRVVEGVLHGLHHSPLHGLSIEFAQHRAYTPGDELKHLDWRVLGRADRYVIKQYQQETNLRAVLFVDCSRSMAFGGRTTPVPDAVAAGPRAGRTDVAAGLRTGRTDAAAGLRTGRTDVAAGLRTGRTDVAPGLRTGRGDPAGAADESADTIRTHSAAQAGVTDARSKFHYARRLAAALSYLMLHQGDSVGLVLTNYRVVEQLPPRAAPGHIMSICDVLERAAPEGITDVSGVLGQLAARLKRRSLVILISDLLDDPDSVLAILGQAHHRGHEVLVFQVLDPREIEFDLGLAGSGVTVIRDMETGEEFAAEPALVRSLVREEVQRFFEKLDAGARRHGIHLLRCSTSEPLEQVLTCYLHSRLRGRGRPASLRRSPPEVGD